MAANNSSVKTGALAPNQTQPVTVVVEQRKNRYAATIKKVGTSPGALNQDAKGLVTYMSDIKDRMLFSNERLIIMFVNHMYRTNDQEDIDLIENSSVFNQGIWKGAFPKEVVEKMENDEKMLTRNTEYFKLPEA